MALQIRHPKMNASVAACPLAFPVWGRADQSTVSVSGSCWPAQDPSQPIQGKTICYYDGPARGRLWGRMWSTDGSLCSAYQPQGALPGNCYRVFSRWHGDHGQRKFSVFSDDNIIASRDPDMDPDR